MFAIAQITVHQRAFRICCTHFESDHTKAETLDGRSTQIGEAQSEHLLSRLPLQPNVMDVIVGDLNATVGDGAVNTLVEHGFIPAIEQARRPRGTAAIDDKSSPPDPSRRHMQKWLDIDWVLARGATQLSATTPLAALPLPSCQMPSDHLPVEALIH
jgi:endonuclease/exonuclease/phosphatase family metal-dependent hydrolase